MYAIETKSLTKSYGEKVVVEDINLKIKKGEIFALLGRNGAGKTTTIKMLSTLIEKTKGEIFIEGFDIDKNKDDIRKIINISPQETAIAYNLSVRENLDFMAGVYQIKDKKAKISYLIEKFGLNEVIEQKASTLSGGFQRKVSIAIALLNNPKILFLDEPSLGLDVISRNDLWEIIRDLKNQMTIILTSHYMQEAEELSDRVGIIDKGKLIDIATVNELKKRTNSNNLEDAFVKIVKGKKDE